MIGKGKNGHDEKRQENSWKEKGRGNAGVRTEAGKG